MYCHHMQIESYAHWPSRCHCRIVCRADAPWVLFCQKRVHVTGTVATWDQTHVDDILDRCMVRIVIDDRWLNVLDTSMGIDWHTREFAAVVFVHTVLRIQHDEALVLWQRFFHVLVRPVVVMLNGFESHWRVRPLSPDQSPLWRHLDLHHETMVARKDNQHVIDGQRLSVLLLDVHVDMAELHPKSLLESRRWDTISFVRVLPPT